MCASSGLSLISTLMIWIGRLNSPPRASMSAVSSSSILFHQSTGPQLTLADRVVAALLAGDDDVGENRALLLPLFWRELDLAVAVEHRQQPVSRIPVVSFGEAL